MNQRVSCTSRSQYAGANQNDANANPSKISLKYDPNGTLRTGASAVSGDPCAKYRGNNPCGGMSSATNPCESLRTSNSGINGDPCSSYKNKAAGMTGGYRDDPCAKARDTGLDRPKDEWDQYNQDGDPNRDGDNESLCECFDARDVDGDNDNTNSDPCAQVKKCGGLKGSFNNACDGLKQCATDMRGNGKYWRILRCLIVFGIGVALTKQMQTVANELG